MEKLRLRRFNFRLIARIVGMLMNYMAASMALPLLVSVYAKDGAQFAIFLSATLMLLMGLLCRNILGHNAAFDLKENESYWVVALAWLLVPLCGTLPYLFTGAIGSFTDAVFESFSGFTTTGASVLPAPEELPPSMLVYRSYTQWIGGLGMMLMIVAMLSRLGVGGGQLYEAEFSGTQQRKLHPHLSNSVKYMWVIYGLFTAVMLVLLLLRGVPLVDALCYSMSTVSTGGFTTHSQGLAMMDNGTLIILSVFMVLSGVNLACLYRLVFRWRKWERDEEVRTYLMLLLAMVAVSTLSFKMVGNPWRDSVEYSVFHIASTMSTCGYYLPKLGHWSFLVSVLTFVLIIIGATSGSTGGGLKLRRVMIVIKYIGNYFTRMLHPNAIFRVKMDGHAVEPDYINKVFGYIFLYIAFIVMGAFVLTLCGCSIPEAICMAAANISNLGPSPLINNLGGSLDYASLHDLGKWALAVLMTAGRLELYALIAIFSPAYWRRG